MARLGYNRFSKGLVLPLKFHRDAVAGIRTGLEAGLKVKEAFDLIESQKEDLEVHLKLIDYAYEKFIQMLEGKNFTDEVDRQSLELFPDKILTENEINYIKIKITYEFIYSFYKLVENAWNNINGLSRLFTTYDYTKDLYDRYFKGPSREIQELNSDLMELIQKIEITYNCKIIGATPKDKHTMVSNLIFDENLDFNYKSFFSESPAGVVENIINQVKPVLNLGQRLGNLAIGKSAASGPSRDKDEYYFTQILGTKEWNRNDAYILTVKKSDLKEEEKKFYISSFVTLNPSENANINLAAALVRKNTGMHVAQKYNKMIATLLDFTVTNLFTKDFADVTDDTKTLMYHVGPVVMYNIIIEDMQRRDFGYCFYVDKNQIVRFFPENIIKKHVIDFWAEKFFDLKTASVDAYITYSKAVVGIKESYRNFFDMAASTKKRTDDTTTTEEYIRENAIKFFGLRRSHVFKRFIPDCVLGYMPEATSTERVNLFGKK